MTQRDEKYWLKAVAVFCSTSNAQDAAALMRTAVASVVAARGATFEDADDEKVFKRSDPAPREWAKRPVFLAHGASSYAVMIDLFWREGALYHYLTIGPDSEIEPSQLADEWQGLVQSVETVLASVGADVGVAFAKPPDMDGDPIKYGDLCGAGAKRILTPWTFLGPHALDAETRNQLSALPGTKTKSIGSGVSIAIVATPGVTPAADAVPAGYEYIDPLLRN